MLLLDLPSEVLELILSESDAYSAIACGRACKGLHRVVTTSMSIRYIIALTMRGMRAGRNESIDLKEKLKLLERYENAWIRGSWKESFRITLPEPMAGVNIRGARLHIHQADGYHLTWTPENGQVHVVRLPSPLRGISLEEYRWIFSPPLDPNHWRTDIRLDAQNSTVMFIVTAYIGAQGTFERYQRVTLYPFDLFSGNVSAHIAPNDTVILEQKGSKYVGFCLRNEFLVMYLELPDLDYRIVVYNWVTQQNLLQVMTATFVTFLDDKRILACFLRRPSPGTDRHLCIYNLSNLDDKGTARATHHLVLPLRPDIDLVLSSGGWMGRGYGHSESQDRTQYFSEDDWGLLYFRTASDIDKYNRSWGRDLTARDAYDFKMYLFTSELRRLTNNAPISLETLTMPWNLWGHAAVLALDRYSMTVNARFEDTMGSRMHDRLDQEFGRAPIYDYHPARVRRSQFHNHPVIQDCRSGVRVLREGELHPGFPVAPRAIDRVYYSSFKLREHNHTDTTYNFELSADVALVYEYVKDSVRIKAIAAYSLV